jgi:hypothetical protein
MKHAIHSLIAIPMLAAIASCNTSGHPRMFNSVAVTVEFDGANCPKLPKALPQNCPAGLDRDGVVCAKSGSDDITWVASPPGKHFGIGYSQNQKSDLCDTSDPDDKKCKVYDKSHFHFNNALGLVYKYDISGDPGCTTIDPYIIVMK